MVSRVTFPLAHSLSNHSDPSDPSASISRASRASRVSTSTPAFPPPTCPNLKKEKGGFHPGNTGPSYQSHQPCQSAVAESLPISSPFSFSFPLSASFPISQSLERHTLANSMRIALCIGKEKKKKKKTSKPARVSSPPLVQRDDIGTAVALSRILILILIDIIVG